MTGQSKGGLPRLTDFKSSSFDIRYLSIFADSSFQTRSYSEHEYQVVVCLVRPLRASLEENGMVRFGPFVS